MTACNNSNSDPNADLKNANGKWKFDCTKIGFDDFVILEGLNKNPSTIKYVFSGNLRNNTANIYKKVFARCELFFELKNGNVLSSEEMTGKYTNGLNFYNWRNWKPQVEENISKLTSSSFGIDYIDYPVVKVMKRTTLELTDEINNTEESIIIGQSDVTDKWKIAIKKVEAGKFDCSDYNLDNWLNSVIRNRVIEKKEPNSSLTSDSEETTKCKVFNRTALYLKPNVDSESIYELQKEDIVWVYMSSYYETPGKFVYCKFIDANGGIHKGYILTSSLQWLEAG